MAYVIIHHDVIDYEKFRSVFDYDAERRRRMGCKGGKLYRSDLGPNDFFAFFEWDTIENARRFISDYETREAFEWVHSVEAVRAFALEEFEDVEY